MPSLSPISSPQPRNPLSGRAVRSAARRHFWRFALKVLWISNRPDAHSGYGSQTRQVGPRIAAAGHEIEFVANDGTYGDREWNGFLVRGSGQDRYSRDTVREDVERSGADWVISLYDAWVYTEQRQDPFEGLPRVASWIPVDHYPTPLSLYEWLTHGHVAIAMSQFGRDCLTTVSAAWQVEYERQNAKGRKVVTPGFPVRYAPHAVEDVFRPVESDFRQQIGVPADAYLIGIVAANYGSFVYDRKGITDMAAALGYFMETHPDAYVYVHTIAEGPQMLKLPTVFAFSGVPEDRIRWADQHALKKHAVTDEEMAAMYSSLDLLLATSRGEGFGIPVIEAQACGTPVIVSNWTAQPELVGEPWNQAEWGLLRYPNGWCVPVLRDYDPRHGADFAKPQLGMIVRSLEEAYEKRGDAAMKDAALAKAAQYRADAVFDEHWRPILREMDAASRPVLLNRDQRRKAMRERTRLVAAR